MIIMRKAEINEIKEIKERNDEVCVGNTRLVKVFSYRLTYTTSKKKRKKKDVIWKFHLVLPLFNEKRSHRS